MSDKGKTYEKNFAQLERITELLNKDEIGIDDLVEKTREALEAARNCIDILRRQQGEFKKLESDFVRLIEESGEEDKE
jgi:exonuclease VII small subunit